MNLPHSLQYQRTGTCLILTPWPPQGVSPDPLTQPTAPSADDCQVSQDRYQQWWHNSVSTGVLKHYKTQRQSYINRKEVERVAGLTWTAHISHQVRPAKAPPPEDVNAHSNPWSPADKTLSGGEDRTACHRIPSVIFTLAPPHPGRRLFAPTVSEEIHINQNQTSQKRFH